MSYSLSKIDKKNIKWFQNDNTRKSLKTINLSSGQLRGLNNFNIQLEYPISVISGKNGSGKSTLLAIAACAFHNKTNGYKLPHRPMPYYRFSDFFIQSKSEIPLEGIKIRYGILHNNWKKTSSFPDGIGLGHQYRIKAKGGKWTEYSRRVNRDVVFLGIERVVPHYEKQVYKSYRYYFKKAEAYGWEDSVKNSVSKILGKEYDNFFYIKHTKYRIPVVEVSNHIYSGFNMGAGENALFEVFSVLYDCPESTLLIIDEIELGLHTEAQRKLIEEIKEVCFKRKIQIIATTHSPTIIKYLPPIARFHFESYSGKTIVTSSISAEFAAGKLSGENSQELDVFVEDKIAHKIINQALPLNLRNRINVIPIGSSFAISRQMAARYKEIKSGGCIAVMDGDKRGEITTHYNIFKKALENDTDENASKEWFMERLLFLPGDKWPEGWILDELIKQESHSFVKSLGLDEDEFQETLRKSKIAGKHNEFYEMSKLIHHDISWITNLCVLEVINNNRDDFTKIEEELIKKLSVN